MSLTASPGLELEDGLDGGDGLAAHSDERLVAESEEDDVDGAETVLR
jgi:hypothetical protein